MLYLLQTAERIGILGKALDSEVRKFKTHGEDSAEGHGQDTPV